MSTVATNARTIDIRTLTLEDVVQADTILLQHLVGNTPTGGGDTLLYTSQEGGGNSLTIQADSTADTGCAIDLLVEAVKGTKTLPQQEDYDSDDSWQVNVDKQIQEMIDSGLLDAPSEKE